MLDLIIDAYKEKTKDKNFFETVKKLDIISKIFLGIFVLDIIMLIIFLILGKFKMALGFIGGFIIFLVAYVCIISKTSSKKWEKNIEKYNESLDVLMEILKQENINCGSKDKIEKLIRQCQDKIDEYNEQKGKLKEGKNGVLEKCVFPIVAFVSGVIAKNINVEDAIKIAAIASVVIIYSIAVYYGGESMIEDISGNRLEKTKYMKAMLEDILIRGI